MFITTIHSFESLEKLKNAGADAIVIGVEKYSIRSSIYVQQKDLFLWKKECERLKLKLYINLLRMVMDEDIPYIHQLLMTCKELDVDGIYYADEGVFFEAKEIGFENHLIYQPETLVTSSHDVSFYLGLGIQSVSLAHELSLDEILSIAKVNKNIEILIHGYFSILYSRRSLVSNYLNAINKKNVETKKRYDLIEQTRTDRMPILEDESGTHIFSECPIQSLNQIEELENAGITRFRIDSIFFDDDWTCEILDLYQLALTGILVDDDESSDRWYYQETIKKKED